MSDIKIFVYRSAWSRTWKEEIDATFRPVVILRVHRHLESRDKKIRV